MHGLIYFDNAATTYPKPLAVKQAVQFFAQSILRHRVTLQKSNGSIEPSRTIKNAGEECLHSKTCFFIVIFGESQITRKWNISEYSLVQCVEWRKPNHEEMEHFRVEACFCTVHFVE